MEILQQEIQKAKEHKDLIIPGEHTRNYVKLIKKTKLSRKFR